MTGALTQACQRADEGKPGVGRQLPLPASFFPDSVLGLSTEGTAMQLLKLSTASYLLVTLPFLGS